MAMTPERLAARYVWWQEPAATLAEPTKLLLQILRLGRDEDYVYARDLWGEDRFRRALLEAPPGALDGRSCNFWHLHYQLAQRPPPRRSFH
jgi:hypothetical protein